MCFPCAMHKRLATPLSDDDGLDAWAIGAVILALVGLAWFHLLSNLER